VKGQESSASGLCPPPSLFSPSPPPPPRQVLQEPIPTFILFFCLFPPSCFPFPLWFLPREGEFAGQIRNLDNLKVFSFFSFGSFFSFFPFSPPFHVQMVTVVAASNSADQCTRVSFFSFLIPVSFFFPAASYSTKR